MMAFDVLFIADLGVTFIFLHISRGSNLANIWYRFAIGFVQISNRFQQFQWTRNLKKKKNKAKNGERVTGPGL